MKRLSAYHKTSICRVAFLLFFCWGNHLSGQGDFVLSTESNEVMIGDQMPLKLQLQIPVGAVVESLNLRFEEAELIPMETIMSGGGTPADADAEIKHPELGIVDLGKWKVSPDTGHFYQSNWLAWDTLRSGNTQILSNTLVMTPWDIGGVVLPPIEVVYREGTRRKTILSNDLKLLVAFPKEPQRVEMTADSIPMAALKPIRKEARKIADFLPLILGLLLLALIGGGLYWYFYIRKAEEVEVPTTRRVLVHELALQKLDALQAKKLWQQGSIKEYQSELTFIVREYLENRYKIQALESTTPEILRQLKPLQFSDDHKQHLQKMLQMADMVKFAKATPEITVHDEIMEQAKNFIHKTKVAETTEENEEDWVEVPLDQLKK